MAELLELRRLIKRIVGVNSVLNLNSLHKRNKSSEIKNIFSIQALHFNSLPELNWIEPNPVQEDHTNPGLDSSLLLPPFPKLISDPCRQDRYGNRTQGFLQSTWVSPPYCFHLSSPLCSVIPRKDKGWGWVLFNGPDVTYSRYSPNKNQITPK